MMVKLLTKYFRFGINSLNKNEKVINTYFSKLLDYRADKDCEEGERSNNKTFRGRKRSK